MAKDSKSDKESEFQKMVRQLGLSKAEIADMLGLTKRNPKTGMQEHKKGGMVKKKMKGGGMAKMAKKKMRGGGMTKMRGGGMSKKKMMGGGMAKMAKKKKMMRGGMAKKKK
jgi:hypothetical protein